LTSRRGRILYLSLSCLSKSFQLEAGYDKAKEEEQTLMDWTRQALLWRSGMNNFGYELMAGVDSSFIAF